jgi:acyl-coenzyme A synthetase/AMP-(fatty) acid ligase/acyl carrier protein
MCPCLAVGATLYLPDEETRLSLQRQISWLRDSMIDVCILPTPIAEAILEEDWPACITLRSLLTGGDKLHAPPRDSIPFRLYNNYGPTESTVIATWTPVPPDDRGRTPHIGRPVDNMRAYILDGRAREVPIGVSGELHISGESLARGYLDRADLTGDRFIPDPFGPDPGGRMYRTGDLVRFRETGDIEYFGRMDGQIKIRGYRIELGEIEVVLGSHPGVREAVVALSKDASGGKRLVGYIVPRDSRTIDEAGLKAYLRDRLPAYMVPSFIVKLDTLPLTPNGKVDRRALPSPPRRARGKGASPRSAFERTIAGIWRDVLALDDIGIHDNFFELGGHSMLLVQAHSRLSKEFEKEISIIDMFKYPTVASLAEYVQRDAIAPPSFTDSEDRGRSRRSSLRRQRRKREAGGAKRGGRGSGE